MLDHSSPLVCGLCGLIMRGLQVEGMSQRDVQVIEINCRSKTGAFFPCDEDVCRYAWGVCVRLGVDGHLVDMINLSCIRVRYDGHYGRADWDYLGMFWCCRLLTKGVKVP